MRLLLIVFLGLMGLGQSAIAQTTAVLQPSALNVPTDKMTGFSAYKLVTLNIEELLNARPSTSEYGVVFTLETSAGRLPFELSALDLRSSGYQLKTVGEGKQSTLFPRYETAQFRGRLTAQDGGTALFTIDDNFVIGTWKQGETVHHLEPLWRFWPEAPRNAYVSYTDQDLVAQTGLCGTEDLDGLVADHSANVNRRMGGCLEVDIALAADFEMFSLFSGGVASVENFMLNTLANVQTNFDDEFDDELSFVVVATVIATTNAEDPWTNSTDGANELLPDFRSWGNGGGFGTIYDVASLWTGRDLDGTSIGWASVGATCSSFRYNILQLFSNNSATLRVLWAHELGHNFGSNHDSGSGDIMAPSVSSATTWSNQSLNAINNYYQSVSCLTACPNPDPPVAAASTPFAEVCDGSTVTFFDESTGEVTTRSWQFPGGFPATSNAAAPSVSYPSPGLYTATLSVGNDFGSDITQVTVRVSEPSNQGPTVLLYETFDSDESAYTIFNPDNENTWEIVEVDGNAGDFAAVINNYDNNLVGQEDRLVMPDLNFTGILNPTLVVEYAYRRYNASLRDQLVIKVNTASSSQTLFTGDEDGSGNFATDVDLQDRFIPKDSEDWCQAGPGCIELDLSAFSNETAVQIVVENVNGYGNFMYVDNILVFGNCSASLPVEWLSFTAEPIDKTSAILNWSVNQDEAHAGFTVQRSADTNPGNWEAMGWIPSNQATVADYTFTDRQIVPGTTYNYRLQQEDLDGAVDYSPIRTLSFEGVDATSVQPNPTNGQLFLLSSKQGQTYTLHDASGKILRSGKLTGQRTDLDLTDLPRALYVLRIGEEVVKVVKQ